MCSDDECRWYDDACFDNVEHRAEGKILSADAWRKYMYMKEREHSVQVISAAGVTFRSDSLKRAIDKGDETVSLVPEPTNRHDTHAVKIEIGSFHVGYVPRGKKVSPNAKGHVLKWSHSPPSVILGVA